MCEFCNAKLGKYREAIRPIQVKPWLIKTFSPTVRHLARSISIGGVRTDDAGSLPSNSSSSKSRISGDDGGVVFSRKQTSKLRCISVFAVVEYSVSVRRFIHSPACIRS